MNLKLSTRKTRTGSTVTPPWWQNGPGRRVSSYLHFPVLILMSTAERFSSSTSSLRLPLGQGHGPLECALRLGVLFVGLAPRGHAEQPGPAFLPGRNAAVLVPVHPSATSTYEALTHLLACRVSTASGKCISLRLPVGPGEARANNNDNNKRIQPWAGQARRLRDRPKSTEDHASVKRKSQVNRPKPRLKPFSGKK